MSILIFCLSLTVVMYVVMVRKCSSKVLGSLATNFTLPLQGGTFVSGDLLKLKTFVLCLVGLVGFTLGVAKCKQVNKHHS